MKQVVFVIIFLCLGAHTYAQKIAPAFQTYPAGNFVKTGDTEIFAKDPVSSTSVNLTNACASEGRYPAWSPEGKNVTRKKCNDYIYYLVKSF